MDLVECSIPEESAYLIPIGDVHYGDKAFGRRGKRKLQGYLDWVRERPNARLFLMGDLFNVASRTSKTSPFETDTSEYSAAVEFFRPVAPQIIGAIDGNHERRMLDSFGVSPTQHFCSALGIRYCGTSAIIRFRVGRRPDSRWYWQSYDLYAHHSTGGGGTLGGALNRAVKLQEIVQGVDAYLIGHNHQLITGVRDVWTPGRVKPELRRVHYIDCGSYLDWDGSYAEAGMFAPSKIGSPRLRFDGRRGEHDVHVSI